MRCLMRDCKSEKKGVRVRFRACADEDHLTVTEMEGNVCPEHMNLVARTEPGTYSISHHLQPEPFIQGP